MSSEYARRDDNAPEWEDSSLQSFEIEAVKPTLPVIFYVLGASGWVLLFSTLVTLFMIFIRWYL